MVTSFFGAESFGGDATYVDRLSRGLLSAGHSVSVVHSAAAYRTVRGSHPGRAYQPPPGLEIHRLGAPRGAAGPLWTHQTGGLGPLGPRIERIFAEGRFDAIHLHNVSLLGGAGAIERANVSGAVSLVSAHDHWHVCPLSSLWRPEGELCTKPSCLRCTARAGRPPQLWRLGDRMAGALAGASAVVYPSEHTRRLHAERGIRCESVVLPYFVPKHAPAADSGRWGRDGRQYVAAAGRLVEEKGFDVLIEAIGRQPGVDLVLAGSGPAEPALRAAARGRPNVRFAGLLDEAAIRTLFAGAIAVVVPSLFWETFGYVVAEAAAVGTPAILRERGPLIEHAAALDAPTFNDAGDLAAAIAGLAGDPELRGRLGETARQVAASQWAEDDHLRRYVDLVDRLRGLGDQTSTWSKRTAPAPT